MVILCLESIFWIIILCKGDKGFIVSIGMASVPPSQSSLCTVILSTSVILHHPFTFHLNACQLNLLI
ncbi:unnamed protein product [Meloidogyne enterolobii]|uniref:Uncharacterized protein n=1 Tax=Meloidogyne enterolobii TaxID=390850 RepID=A0ACB0YDZ8_MELEN